ncbi:helix-turn-helix domain-containing protein [Pseudomonas fragariae (ex Marin et al. 2024)]|uniref:Helix-turn-helix domain-containing protein n=2 Tax=Pseudomonas fragariae (ex Marin et al. 2024) TaxID=3080056 RepID=A0ABT3LP51_9PSED|nr:MULTISPECIES: helix-turn-helix transcriptional regulator [unclassified Pseudomonas]MCW6058222.1 helix-turn-helix domain-containing protein [Pseudomonas fragi]MDV0428317.1 helix-turn-helix transcriptional regulator [Pseudomonas sp. 17]MDX9573961.1 helix-turn-helix transcriptional regulator [Pseudomonas sp. 21(2023)]MDX9586783.1 helix-turn-helix transcriptional regulator [Pseudomonas sp. 19(2023)]MDY6478653.1 helix-turn-helix transcriptional regulator [Pseudomonas sp. 18]
MSLTKFGSQVREYRRERNITLSIMATQLSTSPAFLSAMETGRSKVPMDWASKIAQYFSSTGNTVHETDLKVLAAEANDNVSLEGLPAHHKMLIAGFANSHLNQKQLAKFGELLKEIHAEDRKNDGK